MCEQTEVNNNYIFVIECDFGEICCKNVKNVDKSVDKVDYSSEKGLKMLKKLLFAKSRKKTVQKVDSDACYECVQQPQLDIVLKNVKFKKKD